MTCEPPELRTTTEPPHPWLIERVPGLSGSDRSVPRSVLEALRDLDGEVNVASARMIREFDDGYRLAVVAVRAPRGERSCDSSGPGVTQFIFQAEGQNSNGWGTCLIAYAGETPVSSVCQDGISGGMAHDLRPVGRRMLYLAYGSTDLGSEPSVMEVRNEPDSLDVNFDVTDGSRRRVPSCRRGPRGARHPRDARGPDSSSAPTMRCGSAILGESRRRPSAPPKSQRDAGHCAGRPPASPAGAPRGAAVYYRDTSFWQARRLAARLGIERLETIPAVLESGEETTEDVFVVPDLARSAGPRPRPAARLRLGCAISCPS